jgi:N-acetylglucosaminyl-diphospho-decaprenol L-rhamnosyltransferase
VAAHQLETTTVPVPDAEPRVLDVVIVAWTGAREHVRACLASLREHPLRTGAMAVHVVDNASADGTSDMVRADFPEVELAALGWNSGFCVANNLVLRRTTAPYALLLNPDTVVSAGALDHMVALMDADPTIGVAGCRLVQTDGTFDHAAKRSFPTPLSALAHFTGVGRRTTASGPLAQYRAPDVGEHDVGDVDAVNGAFMLVRRTAMAEVGLLDEAYWVYMEDLDWCYRFKEKGWRVWYDGGATVIHVKGGATVQARKRGRYRSLPHNRAFHRSMARFYRKFYSGQNRLADLVVYAGIASKLLISVTRSAIARRGFS